MWSLVNASYGIAMGQRPTGTEPPTSSRAPRSRARAQERPSQIDPVGARRACAVLRILVAALASPAQLRALAGSRTR